MEKIKLDKLLEQQEKGLDSCSLKIEKWEKFKKDYEVLEARLYSLPDKISHDIMVPFGSMALMPGKIKHTNEVFVLLGEDYFVERSAKQAAEIAGRRIKHCEKMLHELLKEKENLQHWRKYTGEMQEDDPVEIIEEEDPVKEKLWREQHRKSVQAYHRQLAESMKLAEKGTSSSDVSTPMEEKLLTDSEIQDKLSSLEKEEKDNDELAIDEEEYHESSETLGSTSSENEEGAVRKGIKWKDQMYTKNNTIIFTHTTVVTSDESSEEENEFKTEQMTRKPTPVIQSPSDIYKEFVNNIKPKEPKSILKTSSKQATYEETTLFSDSESIPIVNDTMTYPLPKYVTMTTNVTKAVCTQDSGSTKNSKVVFSDTVQEKNSDLKTLQQSSQPTRRISKFKVQRMSGKI